VAVVETIASLAFGLFGKVFESISNR